MRKMPRRIEQNATTGGGGHFDPASTLDSVKLRAHS